MRKEFLGFVRFAAMSQGFIKVSESVLPPEAFPDVSMNFKGSAFPTYRELMARRSGK